MFCIHSYHISQPACYNQNYSETIKTTITLAVSNLLINHSVYLANFQKISSVSLYLSYDEHQGNHWERFLFAAIFRTKPTSQIHCLSRRHCVPMQPCSTVYTNTLAIKQIDLLIFWERGIVTAKHNHIH